MVVVKLIMTVYTNTQLVTLFFSRNFFYQLRYSVPGIDERKRRAEEAWAPRLFSGWSSRAAMQHKCRGIFHTHIVFQFSYMFGNKHPHPSKTVTFPSSRNPVIIHVCMCLTTVVSNEYLSLFKRSSQTEDIPKPSWLCARFDNQMFSPVCLSRRFSVIVGYSFVQRLDRQCPDSAFSKHWSK